MKGDRKRKGGKKGRCRKKEGWGQRGEKEGERRRRKEKEEEGGRIRKGGGGACTHGLTHFFHILTPSLFTHSHSLSLPHPSSLVLSNDSPHHLLPNHTHTHHTHPWGRSSTTTRFHYTQQLIIPITPSVKTQHYMWFSW